MQETKGRQKRQQQQHQRRPEGNGGETKGKKENRVKRTWVGFSERRTQSEVKWTTNLFFFLFFFSFLWRHESETYNTKSKRFLFESPSLSLLFLVLLLFRPLNPGQEYQQQTYFLPDSGQKRERERCKLCRSKSVSQGKNLIPSQWTSRPKHDSIRKRIHFFILSSLVVVPFSVTSLFIPVVCLSRNLWWYMFSIRRRSPQGDSMLPLLAKHLWE